MIQLGKKQKLIIVKAVDFGVYLAEDMHADAKNRVLLPSKQVPEGGKKETNWKFLFIKIPRIV